MTPAAPLEILLVEDNPGDAVLIRRALERDEPDGRYHLVHCTTFHAAMLSLRDGRPACILLDLGLPDRQGLDTLRAFLAEQASIPVVVVTGLSGRMIELDVLKLGACGYLSKDWLVLPRVVVVTVEMALERAARMRRYQAAIEELSSILAEVQGLRVQREDADAAATAATAATPAG